MPAPEQTLKKVTGIGAAPPISMSRKALNTFTGYPLPGGEINRTDLFMRNVPALFPMMGGAVRGLSGIGSSMANTLPIAASPVNSMRMIGNSMTRGMRTNVIPEDVAITDLGAYMKNIKPHSINPTSASGQGLTDAQRAALNYQPAQTEWTGLANIKRLFGMAE